MNTSPRLRSAMCDQIMPDQVFRRLRRGDTSPSPTNDEPRRDHDLGARRSWRTADPHSSNRRPPAKDILRFVGSNPANACSISVFQAYRQATDPPVLRRQNQARHQPATPSPRRDEVSPGRGGECNSISRPQVIRHPTSASGTEGHVSPSPLCTIRFSTLHVANAEMGSRSKRRAATNGSWA